MGSLRSTVEAQAERGRTRGCDSGTAKGPPWGMARRSFPAAVALLDRLLRDVIEDEHRHRALLQFEFQSKLTVERLGQ
jgi:hypothetical protein